MEAELKDNKKYTPEKLKDMRNNLKSLQESEYIEIFNIIRTHTDKYTINNYGVHINMSKLPDNILEKLDNFIIFSKYNKKKLLCDKIERNKILKLIDNVDVNEEYKNFQSKIIDSTKIINL